MTDKSENKVAASVEATEVKAWELINPTTGNTVASYDDRAEAADAAWWYEQSYGKRLHVVGFAADGLAVEVGGS